MVAAVARCKGSVAVFLVMVMMSMAVVPMVVTVMVMVMVVMMWHVDFLLYRKIHRKIYTSIDNVNRLSIALRYTWHKFICSGRDR
jgi:hypothetical protein